MSLCKQLPRTNLFRLKVIVFPQHMGTQVPISPQQPNQDQERRGHDPVVHGSKAAIAAAIFAGLAMPGTFTTAYVNWSNRSDQKTQRAKDDADAHTNSLIDSKMNPAVAMVNGHTDEKFGELSGQIHALDVRIARLEGPLAKRVAGLETRSTQQESIAKLLDPIQVLAVVRATGFRTPKSTIIHLRWILSAIRASYRHFTIPQSSITGQRWRQS